jgi:methyl-accepting chemotaxis protein
VTVDRNGYLPTHNQRYSQPLTGNLANDLVNNRTKRIFNDRTGLAAAQSTAPFLVQNYQRDTGETMADLSVPVFVQGKHWGAVRIGYRRVETPSGR